MNYEDEPYVRLYTTDTATWELLGWEGQTVLMHMLRGKFDRAGIFSCGRHEPSRAVTAVTRLPASLVETGLAALLREDVWVVNNGQLVWPNYHHAQTCPRSDRLRQAESRKNRAKEALAPTIPKPSLASRNVTDSHERSQTSQSVTLSSSLLSCTVPDLDPPLPSVVPPQGGGDRDIGLGDLESFSVDIVIADRPQPPRKKPKQPQWRRFPPDFEPDDSHRVIAQQLGLDLVACLAEIRDHHFDKPKSDAAATFRTWLRNAPKFAPRAPVSRFQQPVSPNVDYETKQRLVAARRYAEFVGGAK